MFRSLPDLKDMAPLEQSIQKDFDEPFTIGKATGRGVYKEPGDLISC